jgi:hypothetical protein
MNEKSGLASLASSKIIAVWSIPLCKMLGCCHRTLCFIFWIFIGTDGSEINFIAEIS